MDELVMYLDGIKADVVKHGNNRWGFQALDGNGNYHWVDVVYNTILRKQVEEWKAAHDNLARQLSVTNDSLEIAVEGLVGIYNQHEHIDNKYAQGAAKMASEALKRLNVQG